MSAIEEINEEQRARLEADNPIPEFAPGDTIRVNVRVVEGQRERVQAFEGVCRAFYDIYNFRAASRRPPEPFSCGRARAARARLEAWCLKPLESKWCLEPKWCLGSREPKRLNNFPWVVDNR